MSQGRAAPPSEDEARPPTARESPNYAARRMLASTVGVALVLAAGVLAWRALRDGSTESESDAGRWNEVVFVNRADGAAVSVDREGTERGTTPSTGRTIDVHVEGSRVALVEASQIALTDLGGTAPEIIPIEPNSVVSRLPIADSLWLAVGKATGGNVVLVDGLSGDTFDFAELAEFTQPTFYIDILRYDPTGTLFAIADATPTNFQTVVVDTGSEPPTVRFFADLPLAVGTDHLVTTQVVGQRADLTLFDADGTRLTTVNDELPAGAALDDDEVVVTSITGAISRFGPDDESAERVGTVAVPAEATISSVRPTADGTRWVVFGGVFEAVVDLDGRTLFTTTFTSQVEQPTVDPAWSCLPVGGGDSYHSIVGLENGEQIAELTGLAVTGVSADGCTVIGTRAGATEVVGAGGSIRLGRVRGAALAPDARAVLVQTTTGATQLTPIDEDWALGEPVDLSEQAPPNAIIAFRQS